MPKRPSEAEFGRALRDVSLPVVVYKPPDDARNWKPADYLVWVVGEAIEDGRRAAASAWFEVKDVDTIDSFNWRGQMRASQLAGIREAARIGLPYWLAIYWRRHHSWTISDAVRLNRAVVGIPPIGSRDRFSRTELMSVYGIDSTKTMLSSTLKSVLLGEI